MTFKVHELAGIFPLLPDKELNELAADIQEHGQRHPIIMLDGEILDGRNRWEACKRAGVDPWMEKYTGDDPVAFVLGENLHRRHLTPSQRAAAAVAVLPFLEEQARARQAHGGTAPGKTLTANVREASGGTAASKAAELTGASERNVEGAAYVKRRSPEGYARIQAGESTVHAEKERIRASDRACDAKSAALHTELAVRRALTLPVVKTGEVLIAIEAHLYHLTDDAERLRSLTEIIKDCRARSVEIQRANAEGATA